MKLFTFSFLAFVGGLFMTDNAAAHYHKDYPHTSPYSSYHPSYYPTQTYYYHPVSYHQDTASTASQCSFCGAPTRSRTFFRDNMTPYQSRTNNYNTTSEKIFRNKQVQPFSCRYLSGK